MRPGQRIKLIKQAATELAKLEWSDIDLTLRTFGLNWTNRWDGNDRYGYCIKFVEEADDKQLLQLHRYLKGEEDSDEPIPSTEESKGPWETRGFKLFLSHLSKNKKAALALKEELQNYGIDVFVAHEDIEPSREWVREIEKALSTCDALAALLTSGFHNSDWTDQEVGMAISRRVLIVPLMLVLTPYGFMGKYQGADIRKLDAKAVAEEIFKLLASHNLTGKLITEALVSKLEDARSYDEANKTAHLLSRVSYWDSETIRRLETAKEKNDQVDGAWNVSGYVSAIVSKYGGQSRD